MKNFYKIRGKREFLFDDKELYVLGTLTLIIFGLIFTLGVMVGQESKQQSYANPLSATQEFSGAEFSAPTQEFSETSEQFNDSQAQPSATTATSEHDSLQRSYYQVLPDSETYIEVEATPVRNAEVEAVSTEESTQAPAAAETSATQPAQTAAPSHPVQIPTRTSQATNIVPALPNVPKSPTEDMRIGRQPSVGAEPTPDGTIYSVQVASSTNREDSERLVRKYGAAGFQAYIMTVNLDEKGVWYRVRVGNMPTREAAEELKDDILTRASQLANSPYVIKLSE